MKDYSKNVAVLLILVIGMVIGLMGSNVSFDAPVQPNLIEMVAERHPEMDSDTQSVVKTVNHYLAHNELLRLVDKRTEVELGEVSVFGNKDPNRVTRMKIPNNNDDDSFLMSQNLTRLGENLISYEIKALNDGTKIISMIDPELVSSARHGGLP